jgi:hypothetical protein
MDRRRHQRVPLKLTCVLHVRGFDGSHVTTTKNIGRGGILLRWPEGEPVAVPKVGGIVTIEVLLPASVRYGQRILDCTGEVVRVSLDKESGDFFVAVRFKQARVSSLPVELPAKVLM